ncbi:MAG: EamA family transporter [Gammaproteobacteria bacterium]|nr:EamA family transporter [Gammaproteobacteria bacterium]MCY4219257.1 EamA family transporter [Gammaproteobacteria bacterium]MCY4275830.1 EamA family transporter [Gammaproteobacteria bacterium]
MKSLLIILLITLCYSGYNLLIKVSMSHAESTSISPIFATIGLQISALMVSIVYLITTARTSVSFSDLPFGAYTWAIAAGICIGIAEILYFYLFRGFSGETPIQASTAIPMVIGGTILITILISVFLFRESLTNAQWLGVALAFVGMTVLAFNSN